MSDETATDPLATIARLRCHVAWLGESSHFGWWQTDALSSDGGGAMLEGILPKTAAWAAMQIAWACAGIVERKLVAGQGRVTLFGLGPSVDARLVAWLRTRKRAGALADRLVPDAAESYATPGDALTAWGVGTARQREVVSGAQALAVGRTTTAELADDARLIGAVQALAAGYRYARAGFVVVPYLEVD